MPSSPLILCCPLLLLPPIPPSIRVFSNESTLHMRWPKYWSFSFSIIPSKEHPGVISFRMDWLDLFAVQGTLKSLLQCHSSKASLLRCSAFFTVQISHPYMTTGKTIALTRQTFVGKVMSLLLNMLSRLVIIFLPRSEVKVKSLSRAQLFATPWIVACPKFLCPWDFQGKSTGVGCPFLLQGISQPRDRTQVSHIVDRCLPSEPPGKSYQGVSIF